MTVGTAVLTFVGIVIYLGSRHRLPRSWSMLLLVTEGIAGVLAIILRDLRTTLQAVPAPLPFGSGTRDGLLLGTNILVSFSMVAVTLALIGSLFFAWSLFRQKQPG